jgi:hypothetical protein
VPLSLNCCGLISRPLIITLDTFTGLLLIHIALHHACRTEAEEDRYCWQSLRGYEPLSHNSVGCFLGESNTRIASRRQILTHGPLCRASLCRKLLPYH